MLDLLFIQKSYFWELWWIAFWFAWFEVFCLFLNPLILVFIMNENTKIWKLKVQKPIAGHKESRTFFVLFSPLYFSGFSRSCIINGLLIHHTSVIFVLGRTEAAGTCREIPVFSSSSSSCSPLRGYTVLCGWNCKIAWLVKFCRAGFPGERMLSNGWNLEFSPLYWKMYAIWLFTNAERKRKIKNLGLWIWMSKWNNS